MTADDAVQALRDAIRADLLDELRTERARYCLATDDNTDDVYAMDGNYLDGFDDAITTLERAA